MSQVPKYSCKEWLKTSIQDGSIECYLESDIKLYDKPIGLGASGAVYKGTARFKSRFKIFTKSKDKKLSALFSEMTFAVKSLLPDNQYDCGEDLQQQFVKEVAYTY